MKKHFKWSLVASMIILTSCAIYAPQKRSTINGSLSEQFSLYSKKSTHTKSPWWKSFKSSELNTLINDALKNNPDIQQTWARLAQADAIARKAGAVKQPELSYSGNAGSTRQRTSSGQTLSTDSFKTFGLGISASYELDLWGRNKSQIKATSLEHEASRAQLHTVAITLSSQIALNWAGIIAQRLQTELINKQLEINKTSLELIRLRFRKSHATALDVYQQEQAVASTQARIPLAELREKLLINQLSVLLGHNDFKTLSISDEDLPRIKELSDIGIPADILAHRPDVKQAGLRLNAADWSVSAARADRLPTFRLSASGSYGGNNVDVTDLFDTWISNLAASVTGPIFDGGRRKAEVSRTRAVVDERLAIYKETVINAFREVEDALISEQKQRKYLEALDRNLELSRNSHKEALARYRTGLIKYLPVLIELRNLQTLELDRVSAQYNLLQYRINLYRALGGEWANELQAPAVKNNK